MFSKIESYTKMFVQKGNIIIAVPSVHFFNTTRKIGCKPSIGISLQPIEDKPYPMQQCCQKQRTISKSSWSSQAGVKCSATSNPLAFSPTRQHAPGNLQPFPARYIVRYQAVHLSRSQWQHEQTFVTQAGHSNVLSVKLQAPYVWHSVNLLPQESHLLQLPNAHACGSILCQQPHK